MKYSVKATLSCCRTKKRTSRVVELVNGELITLRLSDAELFYYAKEIMRPEILLIIGVIILTIVISVIVKKAQSPKRTPIHGIKCPKCGNKKVYWAGYSDRKICKRGHIFT